MKLISYTASNGKEYIVGSKVYLGTGTKDNQYFKYIHTLSPHNRLPVYFNPRGYFNPNRSLPAEYEGQIMEVKIIRQLGSKRDGYRIYLIGGISGNPHIRTHWIDIEAAIQSGEVVLPK